MNASTTWPAEQRDFVEWRRGRRSFAVWALDAEISPVIARCHRLQAALAPWLMPDYVRQPHVTLGWCGFPAEIPSLADDFGPGELRRQLAALQEAPLPFSLRIGEPASFASAAYLSVGDPEGGIAQLRQILAPAVEATGFDFVPHVSFGLYRQVVPLAEMRAAMAETDSGQGCEIRVKRVFWMSYEAAVVGGPLRKLAAFDLQRRRFVVYAPARMRRLFGPGWQAAIFA